MKLTIRTNYRVSVSGTVQLAPIDGAQDVQLPVTGVVIHPRRLGDFGSFVMSAGLVSSNPDEDYRRRCGDILAGLRQQHPWLKAEIVCDTREECSYCGLAWEVFTAEDAARYPDWTDPVGLPQCCEQAQAEFHTAKKETVR